MLNICLLFFVSGIVLKLNQKGEAVFFTFVLILGFVLLALFVGWVVFLTFSQNHPDTDLNAAENASPKTDSPKTCAQLNGFECDSTKVCNADFLDANDSERCCPNECSEPEKTCSGNVSIKTCLESKPSYCNEDLTISDNCTVCGCAEGFSCNDQTKNCVENSPPITPPETPVVFKKFVFDLNGTESEAPSIEAGKMYTVIVQVFSQDHSKKFSAITVVDSNPSNNFDARMVDCYGAFFCEADFNVTERWAGTTDYNAVATATDGSEYNATRRLISLASCGNALCEEGENPTSCSSDCSLNVCGNHVCDLSERPKTCPADCSINICGNHVCDKGETPDSCSGDCVVNVCGNNVCDPSENKQNCFADCNSGCGNAICETGENPSTCERDCPLSACGNNVCDSQETIQNCVKDCPVNSCGNHVCESTENVENCAADCVPNVCGNNTCDGMEKPSTCSADCKVNVCGNNVCDSGENSSSCPHDCHAWVCGNNVCEVGETPQNCITDCTYGICGNHVCDSGETNATCSTDCP